MIIMSIDYSPDDIVDSPVELHRVRAQIEPMYGGFGGFIPPNFGTLETPS